MLSFKKIAIASMLVVAQLSLNAQNNTNSPYTRFGYGELADRSFGAGRAMGGVGIGLRSPKQINPLNPASYSSMDSLTFLFDFGASGQLSWFYDGVNRQKNLNGNVEYIALQFPVTRWLAVSAGLLPYSHVGYSFGKAYTEVASPYQEVFTGTGSLSEVYAGLSVDIWKKRLAVGANVGYLFGDLAHNRSLQFTSGSNYKNVLYMKQLDVRDVKFDFGIQYTHPVGKREYLTLGATYSPGKRLNAESYNLSQIGNENSGTGYETTTDTVRGQRSDIATSFGFGASYVKENKLTLAADFLFENWSRCYYFGEKGSFKDRLRVAAGAEYIPNYMERNYLKRIRYRAGFHYSNSYLNISMKEGNATKQGGYDEYGASLGFGLPLIDNRSFLNISFEYVKVKPALKSMIDEQHFRFTVNYTFNELWFYKRKLD